VAPALAVLRTYATARGQRAEVRLTDGTRVVLAPATTLRILGDTTDGNRTFGAGASGLRGVALDGEAYFEVTHDAAHPFEVRTAHGIARDLGTAFVVSSYPEVQGMRVAVRSGLVALHRALPLVALHPTAASSKRPADSPSVDAAPLVTLGKGDLARVDTSGMVTLARGADVEPYIAWTHDSLVFRGTPLREVAAALSRWYDLDVVLGDSAIGDRHLALTLDTEAPDVALRLIALSLDLRVERRGQTVSLYPLHHDQPTRAGRRSRHTPEGSR
jgi:transmembrane sensor